nr:16S rRNA (guanine(527)-N(7))-methyltransferase RsmG [Mesorhizobium shangrilense]
MEARFVELKQAAGTVSRETFEDLLAFESLFRKWAARINLAAPSTLGDLWRRHILDSAQLIRHAADAERWVDLGSGGGFPGLVIAIFLKRRSGAHLDLVESNRKKCAFLQAVVTDLALPARVHASRIEAVVPTLGTPHVVTSRALAPLPLLLELSEPLLLQGGRALFHKGRDYRREIEESAEDWEFDLVEHVSLVEHDSVILDISNLRRRQG